MKELTTVRPLVLGLIGLPGSGKSRFAAQFSAMFGTPVTEADMLRRALFGDKPAPQDMQAGLRNAYWNVAGELFKTKRMFVLDGNLDTFATRGTVRALAKKAGYDIMWLWIQTSPDVAEDRARKHARGATNTILSSEGFAAALNTFEQPRANEPHIVISGQRTFSSQVRPVLKRIAESNGDRGSVRPGERAPQADTPRPRRNIFIR